MRGHRPDRGVTHARQEIVIGHVAGSNQLSAGLVQTTLSKLLHKAAALARGHEDEDRVWLGVSGALPERGEVRIGERYSDGFSHRTAGRLEALGKGFLCVVTGRIVGNDSDDFLDFI